MRQYAIAVLCILLAVLCGTRVWADPACVGTQCQVGASTPPAGAVPPTTVLDAEHSTPGAPVYILVDAAPVVDTAPIQRGLDGLNPDLQPMLEAAQALSDRRTLRAIHRVEWLVRLAAVVDVVTTVRGLQHGAIEGNPLLRPLTRSTPLFAAVRLGMAEVLIIRCRKLPLGDRLRMLQIAAGFQAMVDLHNATITP